MEAEEQRRQMSQVGEGENEASLSLPCGRQKTNLIQTPLIIVLTIVVMLVLL